MFSGGTKGNINPKWVRQQQYWRERHNLMLVTWNTSSSILKQNDYKNKTTWLNQTTLSESFSLFHATYTEDVKEFFRIIFSFKICFILKDLAAKSFLNFRKMWNVNLTNVSEWLENKMTCGMKDRKELPWS